jgi:hypothetical protein
MDDKREPVVEAVANFADELPHFIASLFPHDPLLER